MAIDLLVRYSVVKQEPAEASREMIAPLLLTGERLELAYTHSRDKVWFTSLRIVALDVQGLTGKKKSFRSFPYTKISSFEVETSGTFDLDSDFRIWVSGVGVFEVKFGRTIDIKAVGAYLSEKVLLGGSAVPGPGLASGLGSSAPPPLPS